MKPAVLLLAGVLGLLATGDTRRHSPRTGTVSRSKSANVKYPQANRAARHLLSTVHDLQAARTPANSTVNRADTGNLWTDVRNLRRAGANTRAIEYYTSDLEHSLRRGSQGAAAARHALNNLEYEANLLRQRQRRY